MPSCDFLHVQAYDGIVLAKVAKERLLDAAAINSLGEGLNQLLDRYPKISLVLDLSEVGYLSSAVLGKLVALHKQVKTLKGRMALAGMKPAILPLFKVTNLDKVFEIHAEAQLALIAYRKKPL
ncbi:hypothetical protein LBMAG53_34410 [Planctomycetota bacterium]|nr:hypothetical protein LBMAG53_34410 [Planctomycetota bacterium]